MPLKKKSKKVDGSAQSNPDILAWTREPDDADEGFTGLSATQMSGYPPPPHMNGGPMVSFSRSPTQERLQPLTREEDTAFVLHQASQTQAPSMQRNIAMMSNGWQSQAPYTPPMGQKRKKDKKEKKKEKKGKGEKKDMKISAPLNVRHVGMPGVMHLATPLPNQANFTVEHLATMPVEGQLSHISPYESLRKVRDLVRRGDIWTQEVILAISPTEITIRDGSTKSSLNVIPLVSVMDCSFIQDPNSHSNVLVIFSQDHNHHPRMHFFQCATTPAEGISNEVQQAVRRYHQLQEEEIRKRRKGNFFGDRKSPSTNHTLGENWSLEARHTPPPPPSHPPPPPQSYSQTPVSPPRAGIHITEDAASAQGGSPALADGPTRRMSRSATDPQIHTGSFSQTELHSMSDTRDDTSIGSGSTPLQRHKRMGDFVSRASTKYISNVHARSTTGKADVEIRRTMKASRIQRDVDILNHVYDDLDAFMRLLREKSAAWSELERKMKKSKRKKHEAALEALRRKAEPPGEEEFLEAYQKCKFGLNLVVKLGHHLSSPSPAVLLRGIFKYLQELVTLNKGPQLASTVVSPLFTKATIDFMTRKLTGKESALWNQLGGNWIITSDQWPSFRPLPPEYEIRFSDGCVPPNLHNTTDLPASFPTLDTLPRDNRGPDYSDAYDGDQPVTEFGHGGLMINRAVAEAVASKAAMVTSPILPSVVVTRRPSMSDHHTSQLSLSSIGSFENAEKEGKIAKAMFDYQASALEEISIHRGERVEVLDDSRQWWMVKNYQGVIGYLPSNLLEMQPPRRKSTSQADIRQADDTSFFSFHGKMVPAPPKASPPPIPSPADARRSSTTSKHSPQTQPQSRKVSQQPQYLSTVIEVSESRSSTISRPAPGLPPPPLFSPHPPPMARTSGPAPPLPPPPPPGPSGPLPPGVPPPPPPPPVAALVPQMSMNDLISQHKLRTAQQGKSQKKKIHEQEHEFDIAGALKNRKPLRKVSAATTLEGVGLSSAGNMQSELERQLRGRKLSVEQEEPDLEYVVLPWKANKSEIKQWLIDMGYGSCADMIPCSSGRQLYQMSRDDLREICGISDGVRLYSQLQRDKLKAEKEGGAAKESQFQKLMRERKSKADKPIGSGEEPTFVKEWGRNKQQDTKPPLAGKKPGRLTDRETLLDDSFLNRGIRTRRGNVGNEPLRRISGSSRRDLELTPKRRGDRKYSEEYYEEDRGGRQRKYSGDYPDVGRRNRRYSGEYYDEETLSRRGRRDRDDERRGGRRSRKSSRSGAYSDDEGYRRKREKDRRRLDYDSEEERRRHMRNKYKKRGPTNIDDFEEDDLSGFESDTESSSSDYSDSESSESDSVYGRKRRGLRSSASASELTNATWALGEGDINKQIKMQQEDIKKQLSSLGQLQKTLGLKALPSQQQKVLQADLQKLGQLQTRLKDKPGDHNLQMQLIGQQMILCQHLNEAHTAIQTGTQSGIVHSQSAQNLKLQMLQQQQQALAEQQRQILYEQQIEAEQQRQMLLAVEQQRQEAQRQIMLAEHQRQMQLAQLAQFQSQQQMQAQQQMLAQQQFQAAGLASPGMAVYSPYAGPVAYY